MMIKLSNGVEVSEDTVVSALKKAGISVEPKHVFEAGDVAISDTYDEVRIIVKGGDGTLNAVNINGYWMSRGQSSFESFNYRYIGKLIDLLKVL